MKKTITSVLALLMLLCCLTACGGESGKSADLSAFWDTLSEKYEMPAMIENADDIKDSYYPGLSELSLKQSVIKAPMMSATVSEYVFVECESAADAAKAAEILQKRVDDQAAGGAWYPDSVENWAKAQVVTNGNYAAMVAAGDNTAAIVEAFNALFA